MAANLDEVLDGDPGDPAALDNILATSEAPSAFDTLMDAHDQAIGSSVSGFDSGATPTAPEKGRSFLKDPNDPYSLDFSEDHSGFAQPSPTQGSTFETTGASEITGANIKETFANGNVVNYKPYVPPAAQQQQGPTNAELLGGAEIGALPERWQNNAIESGRQLAQKQFPQRRDMRYSFFPDSNPNRVTLPDPYTAPSALGLNRRVPTRAQPLFP